MNLFGRQVGLTEPFFLIAGPCVLESREAAIQVAEELRGIAERLGLMVIFKASCDKANRTSHESYRGPGLDEGLEILRFIKERTGLPTLTDVHSVDQVRPVSQAVDVIQTPAFLCRQTDLINAVAASGRPANIKKGQFLSPDEMGSVIAKARSVGAEQ